METISFRITVIGNKYMNAYIYMQVIIIIIKTYVRKPEIYFTINVSKFVCLCVSVRGSLLNRKLQVSDYFTQILTWLWDQHWLCEVDLWSHFRSVKVIKRQKYDISGQTVWDRNFNMKYGIVFWSHEPWNRWARIHDFRTSCYILEVQG